jgi:hypothetical protein
MKMLERGLGAFQLSALTMNMTQPPEIVIGSEN